ncbi:hypothetical protein JCM19275_3672 [Nonlabens ulvanivorans]|uniref:SnoaL-like domain-containing protein n=1 Tax=Nonlabens ulvanivorans TaxID=906888 RepID=A0A090WL89_NONUL|nr:hypothetical protein JCM19275_3672 [Nonlabens ulvanivorans]
MDYTVTTKPIHAIKTQLYKWYSFYEREMNEERILNQFELLSDSIVINSMGGNTVKGKKEYRNILPAYKGTKNAHNLISVKMNESTGKISAEAKILFQTIRPDSTNAHMEIGYEILSTEFDGKNPPKLQQITIKPLEQQDFNSFEDTYPKNRLSALMHYWLLNIEQMDGDAEPFKKLLANNFELHFSKDNVVTSIEQFEKWIEYAASAVSETNHFPENFEVKILEENLYEMDVDFIWRGKSLDGNKLQAITHHKWIVEDDSNAQFAKIRKMEVSYKVPFSPLNQ